MRDERFSGSVCKISRAGKWFFVASGLTYANDEQVADIGVKAGQSARSTNQAAELFRKRMRDFLPGALARENGLTHFDAAGPNRLVLEAAFVGIESSGSKVSVEWYRHDDRSQSAKFVSDRRTYSFSRPGSEFEIVTLGRAHAINARLPNRIVRIRSDAEAVRLLEQLVGYEIAESPETTAPPIDILKLDSSGAYWLKSKPACSAPSY